ncbi:MAG: ribonuclease III [Gammaproteobacteria bacterium]
MKILEDKLDYHFKDLNLLRLALTHKSIGSKNYERLEFLGDSLLGFVISKKLYDLFPDIDEGKLSRLRSHLVRGKTLSEIAKEIDLKEYIILGPGELKSGGMRRESIQADAIEAILGAIYLDSDLETTRNVILKLFAERVDMLDPNESLKDAKTQLQELLQKFKRPLPEYQLIEMIGKDHDAIFTVKCSTVEPKTEVQESAKSIKRAEQMCAKKMLDYFLKNGF